MSNTLPKQGNVKILITDDHAIVRVGSSMIIKNFLANVTIHHAESFNEMMQKLDIEKYDLLILDINMPGGNNFQMIENVRQKQSDIKILMFSAYDEQLYATRYLKAGVNGYLHKNSSEIEFQTAVNTILNNRQYMSPMIKEHLVNNVINKVKSSENPLGDLSNREIEVARFLIQGLGLLEITKELNLSMSTVSTYKNRIFEKLAVSNIAELIEKFRLYDSSIQ